jgi:hypothetical protein
LRDRPTPKLHRCSGAKTGVKNQLKSAGGAVTKLLRVLTATIALSTVVGGPPAAHAENCWMVGCTGLMGYVYIPHLGPYEGSCEDTAQFNPFGDKDIPDVNTIVTNQIGGTGVYAAAQIESEIKDFPRISVTVVDGKCKSELIAAKPAPLGMSMAKGERVRILGYRTFHADTELWRDLLFAFVMVVD